ncbi:MAG: hypothetical protein R3313_01745 [Candidatus Saccharimonadales bacterium]|nr:hypothetical protein [Candidatus Saccharimonadales bacterium]
MSNNGSERFEPQPAPMGIATMYGEHWGIPRDPTDSDEDYRGRVVDYLNGTNRAVEAEEARNGYSHTDPEHGFDAEAVAMGLVRGRVAKREREGQPVTDLVNLGPEDFAAAMAHLFQIGR